MDQAKVAFLILSDDPNRVVPGLIMAARMKENRGSDVRVLFFGPGIKLAADGLIDQQIEDLAKLEIKVAACSNLATSYGVEASMQERPIELLSAGAEVERFAIEGFTVLSF